MENESDISTDYLDSELCRILEFIQHESDALPADKRRDFIRDFQTLYNNFVDEYETKLAELKADVDGLPSFVKDVNQKFEAATKLTKTDDAFLIFSTVLQIIRQIFINKYKDRLDDQEAADRNKWHKEEHSNRQREYYASIEEMRSNPVPFDTVRKETDLHQSEDNPRISGFNHRYKAIGHDPILGLIFGTANIMTNTLTMTEGKLKIKSYHVHTGQGFNGSSYYDIDKMYKRADTLRIFSSITKRIKTEEDGWKSLRVALAKEIVHLLTDVRTQKSLPLPFISLLSPKVSQILNYAEIDTLTLKIIGKEAGLAALINYLIATLHEWCYDETKDGDKELYDVRTKKIIQYSGELALASTTLQTAVKIYLGDLSSIKHFDFGGSIITLCNTWNTPMKIAKIKGEYLISNCCQYIGGN